MTTTTPHPPAVVAAVSPTQRVLDAYRRIAAADRPEIWITLRPEAHVLADAAAVERRLAAGEDLPLAGTVLAVKDNVDVAGLPTTAGHPDFPRLPDRTATAVQRLLDAGTIVLGKTNMDQFATGLTGARSPYGVVRSAEHPDRVSGGSSAGSGAAVGLGLVDLAVATDTAGSGRVPAAFNGVVGIKSTLGLVPTDGVVPACPSYDCVTVLAPTLALATLATRLMTGRGELDPSSRTWPADVRLAAPARPRVAVPRDADLALLSPAARARFDEARSGLVAHGAVTAEVDLTPFLAGARLLYDGALVAERYAAFGEFLTAHPDGADPSVAAITRGAATVTGPDVIRDQHRLRSLRAQALAALEGFDALLVPTAPEHPTIAQVAADPLGVNARLGTYTNFVNLFDLAAVAVPAGTADGGRFGVTVVTRGFEDQVGLDIAAMLVGEPPAAVPYPTGGVPLVAFGAHLRGEPRNGQLEALGARFVREVATAPHYAMHLAADGLRPVVVRTAEGAGAALPGEEWLLSAAALGTLLTTVDAPLALGKVVLDDGREVVGFTGALTGAEPDITSPGGWRAYRHG
ncbi:allophanate hydrolase [Cellulomonas aerilata]|uniref:Allophanate hydrolase n=1 Tax=Cellulomonas aerilata TaxID=515326 RepID=A0A512D940_9CELL|nr:allophanate hydrolase [Cellulomonas aerilata]GEO32998.1 allophanate hydrolase [Cellulomonas aerilata]